MDGGILSNFPIWLFDSKGEPDWPTFGLKLIEPEFGKPQDVAESDEPGERGRKADPADEGVRKSESHGSNLDVDASLEIRVIESAPGLSQMCCQVSMEMREEEKRPASRARSQGRRRTARRGRERGGFSPVIAIPEWCLAAAEGLSGSARRRDASYSTGDS